MKHFFISGSIFMVLCLFIQACHQHPDDTPIQEEVNIWDTLTPFVTSYFTSDLVLTDLFDSNPQSLGTVAMPEASGIAWSQKNPDMIWAHNDSGNPNTLYLISSIDAQIKATYRVQGATNLDWEDIEVGPGPISGEFYIYIADTGDNSQQRSEYVIYRFPEPVFTEDQTGAQLDIGAAGVDKLRFRYPDKSHDNESLMVDLLTADIFLATKRDLKSLLFVAPFPQPTDSVFQVIKAGTFSFTSVSAASVSPDANMVVIKNRQEIYFWERKPNESFVNMLSRVPFKAPYDGEHQGEAICFDLQNNYYTLSEAESQELLPRLYKYNLR